MLDTSAIRLLTPADLESALAVQSRAFITDPLWCFLLPEESKRAVLLSRFFKVFVSAGIRNNQAYGVGDPLEGIAIWSAPGQPETGLSALVQAGFLNLFASRFVFSLARAFPIFNQFDRMQKQYAPDPHYYLNTIGVAPESQGKGVASKLIKPFLAQADEQGVSAYTETITPSNVSLYEHYGFRVMEVYLVPNTDLRLWSFYRPAVSPG
jgi:ribosomal protein S18 acetylase RimI-like enzyme